MQVRRPGFNPWAGKIPLEKGMVSPRLYSSLGENLMSRETWWATVHGVAKGQTRLSD